MPIVTIQVTREGTTAEQSSVSAEEKAALIKGASELLLNVLNKPLESTFVVIEEVDIDNWGWGGLPVLEFRRRISAPPTSPAISPARCSRGHWPPAFRAASLSTQ
jgi:4-oxalocrotonate tautomerase